MKFTIRPYRESDWAGVCGAHDAARPLEVETFVPEGTTLPMEEAVKTETGFFKSDVFVAVDLEDSIMGFIAVHGDELSWLYIHPDYFGQGVGTKLVEHVRSRLEPNGHVLCLQENRYGFPFYQKMGFQPAAYFPGHVQGHPCTCVRLTLPGSVHADREPRPLKSSLAAHGYSEDNWGKAVRDEEGVWRWVRQEEKREKKKEKS